MAGATTYQIVEELIMKWCAPVAALVFASAAQALPLNVTETTDFIGSPGPPTPVGTLDLGLNTISGHVDMATDPTGDLVGAVLPLGLQITAVTLELSNFTGSGSDKATFAVLTPLTFLDQQRLSPDGAYAFTNGLPASTATDYGFGNEISPDSAGVGFDWKWNIDVAAVPEPGTALLLGLGLVGLARPSRRAPTNRLRQR